MPSPPTTAYNMRITTPDIICTSRGPVSSSEWLILLRCLVVVYLQYSSSRLEFYFCFLFHELEGACEFSVAITSY